MRDHYLKSSDVIVIVMSYHTREEDVESHVSRAIRVKDDENIPIVFAVNKIDLDDNFPVEYIHKAAKYNGAKNYSICKTSAKTGEGVAELFDEVIKRARIGNVKTIECIKNILAMDKDIIKRYPIPHKKKKCLVM